MSDNSNISYVNSYRYGCKFSDFCEVIRLIEFLKEYEDNTDNTKYGYIDIDVLKINFDSYNPSFLGEIVFECNQNYLNMLEILKMCGSSTWSRHMTESLKLLS